MATPTGFLFYDPRPKPLASNGTFQAGSYYLFYATGTTTPANVYQDGLLATPLSQTPGANQPSCTADSTGRFNPIYLNPAQVYRVQLYNAQGVLQEDTDPFVIPSVTFTQQTLGQLLYPQTTQEANAVTPQTSTANPVVPTYYFYPPGNVKRYGAAGDGVTDDSAAINAALRQCAQRGGAAVYFPRTIGLTTGTNYGQYAVTSTIQLNPNGGTSSNTLSGPYMYGETDRLSISGPGIRQLTSGIDLFQLTGSGPTSFTARDLLFSAQSATAVGSLVNITPTTPFGPNSFYFYNCWFQSPPLYALTVNLCDDVKVINCTFDISGEKWLSIGLVGLVTNMRVANCTFADSVNAGAVDVGSVRGFSFVDNNCYSNNTFYGPTYTNSPYFFNLNTNAVAITDVTITGNVFAGYNAVLTLTHLTSHLVFSNNVIDAVQGGASTQANAIAFGGGTTVSDIVITGNVIRGFCTLSTYSGGASTVGMIDATGTPVSNCVFTGNIIFGNFTIGSTFGSTNPNTGTSAYCLNLPAGGANNRVDNLYSGATIASFNAASYANYGVTLNGNFTITMTGISGTTTGTARYQVNGNAVTLFLPAISGAATSTAVTLTGLPVALQSGYTQSFQIIVTNNSANVLGSVQVAATSSTLTLNVGSAFGAFANTGTQGVQATSVTYILG